MAVTVYNIQPIIRYLCDTRDIIAELDVGPQRSVIITAGNCWEISRPIYYKVREAGRVIRPTTYIHGDRNDSYAYAVVFAEGGTLVGVMETTLTSPELVIMQDFESGESWPRLRDDEVSYYEPVREKWRGIFERLRHENPNLPMPDYFNPLPPGVAPDPNEPLCR